MTIVSLATLLLAIYLIPQSIQNSTWYSNQSYSEVTDQLNSYFIPPRPPYYLRRPVFRPPPFYRNFNPAVTTTLAPTTTQKWFKMMPQGTVFAFHNVFQMPFQPPMDWIVINMSVTYRYNASHYAAFRRKRSLPQEHVNIFQSLENSLSTLGIDARSCIKHAICEMSAEKRTDHKTGILGEIATTILRPRAARGIYLDPYAEARNEGRGDVDCWEKYAKSCPFSILQFLSNLELSPK